jgi:NADH pyrophosphatase NudC (nudix superfamily)
MPDNNDEGMDKYAVEEDGSGVKTADAQEGYCPNCGTKLEPAETTNVLKCPKCGTKPFEDAR